MPLLSKEPAMRSDNELQHDARLELVRELGVDAERIEIRVRDGVAILSGNVRSEAESWSVADVVRRVPGIQSVHDETIIIGHRRSFLRIPAPMSRVRGFPRSEHDSP
jgi:osmotically-inducible protein OsmY